MNGDELSVPGLVRVVVVRGPLHCRETLSGDKCLYCTPHKVVVVFSSFHLSASTSFSPNLSSLPSLMYVRMYCCELVVDRLYILLGGWLAFRFFCGHYTPILLSHRECGNELMSA